MLPSFEFAAQARFRHACPMKRRDALLPLLCAGIFAGCQTLETEPRPEAGTRIYRGGTFQLRYPPSVTTAIDQGDGFMAHYFRVGQSKCMMGVYEGQKPKLFSKKTKDLSIMRRGVTSRKNIDRGDDLWGVDSNGKTWRESLWSCRQNIRAENDKAIPVAVLIHIWYFGASDEEQIIFDSIADTIEFR